MAEITRRFIDWQQPALQAVTTDLVAKSRVMGFCDLSSMILVFPGQRAGRRFLELLAGQTQNRNIPPEVITVGDLAERLYRPQKPLADELTQRFAWKRTLLNLPTELVRRVIPFPPQEEDIAAWLRVGEAFATLHRQLAADGLRFADVPGKLPESETREQERWEALAEFQREYLRILDGLEIWDQQTARLVAIEKQECRTTKEIVLVGTVDMNQTLRLMLDQVAGQVTAYIHAPASLARRFDSHGCLRPKQWSELPIELNDQQMVLVDKPLDQARAVAARLASCQGRLRVDEVTVGVADETLVPPLQRLLGQGGVATRWTAGQPFGESSLAHLLQALRVYLEQGTTAAFAALVRHPDMADWLNHQGAASKWLIELDRYISEHLPSRLGTWLKGWTEIEPVQQVYELVESSLVPLRGESRLLGQWREPLTLWMQSLYGHREFDPESERDAGTLAACAIAQCGLEGLARLPGALAPAVSGALALHLVVEQMSRNLVPPPPRDEALELLGWLELPLDDANELVIAGFNEGCVPSSLNSDLFLPNTLRAHLGMMDNERRLARDVYALNAILHSRRRVTLIGGRRDARDEPLHPSRLWFATEPEVIARRVERFYGASAISGAAVLAALAGPSPAAESESDLLERLSQEALPEVPYDSGMSDESPRIRPTRLTIPRPASARHFEGELSVTAFSDYLASPYRFYLKHVLKLDTLGDDVEELNARDFGNLIHRVLKSFGESRWRHSKDDTAIATYLEQQLEQSADELYGGDPLFPVRIQIEQARDRLKAFSRWQAERTRDGWEVAYTELKGHWTLPLGDMSSIEVVGRIDRIDWHRDDHRWAIIDYKTGEEGKTPERAHRVRGEWVDLQLPIYRHLAAEVGVCGDVALGYISIPRDHDKLDWLPADWSHEDLTSADEVARQTACQILRGEFWVELDRPTKSHPEFGPICQDGVMNREAVV